MVNQLTPGTAMLACQPGVTADGAWTFAAPAAGTEIGSGAQKMVRGDELKAWADQLVIGLQAIVTWGASVTPPLAGVIIPSFPGTVLSSKNKVE